MKTRARLGGVAAMLVVAAGGGGCSTYTHQAIRVREPLARGDFAGARRFLEEHKPGGDGLPYLMELGLVLRYREEFARSNEVFEVAENVVDELYTRSLSREALALATSDETIPYRGEVWERVLINYYRALNYVDLGEFDEALVECRKINHKLKVYTDAADDLPTYRQDAFAQYLTAILYEAAGDLDDAWVSLRLADEGYEHYAAAYRVEPPASLPADLLRLAEQQGFAEDLAELRERFPETEWMPTPKLLEKGEVVVFYEEGFIPAKTQEVLTIPILKHEYDEDHEALAGRLAGRVRHPIRYEKSELQYLLRVALPAFPRRVPAERPGHAVVSNGVVSARSQLAQDLGAIARRGLEDRMGGILFKTILRGLTKYALTRSAEKKGTVAGRIANLVTAATEKADTRGWITLPGTIHVVRLVVEPGSHDLELRCYGPEGALREVVVFADVRIGPGEVRILSHRTF